MYKILVRYPGEQQVWEEAQVEKLSYAFNRLVDMMENGNREVIVLQSGGGETLMALKRQGEDWNAVLSLFPCIFPSFLPLKAACN